MAGRENLAWRWTAGIAVAVLIVTGLCAYIWREEILRTALDPKQPFQTYRPPPAPDYARRSAWAILPADPAHPAPSDPPVDVFFVHPTTYDGGRDWNAPIGQRAADAFLFRVVLPNYAGPFQRVGRVFAPRYRQASLYAAVLTLRDDARDARRFAYGDVRTAFLAYLRHDNLGRPIVLAGVGQGGAMVTRLVQDVVAHDHGLLDRIAVVYLTDVLAPASQFAADAPLPACRRRDQARCVVGWRPIASEDPAEAKRVLDRALVWTPEGQLVGLGNRAALCVDPVTGMQDGSAPAKLNIGAANASGVEWGVRPAFMPRQVSTRCEGGLLHVSRPLSAMLRPAGSWAGRRKVAPYNLFYADIEADAQARVQALLGRRIYGAPAPPITNSVKVEGGPTHVID